MNELDELRKKKMELYKQQYASSLQQDLNEEVQLQQQLQQLESTLKQVMTADALQRYANLKLGHPEKAVQALVVIAQLLQSGNIRIVDDAQLKNVLLHLTPDKKQTRFKLHGAV